MNIAGDNFDMTVFLTRKEVKTPTTEATTPIVIIANVAIV
jgi:hypothetical protein